MKLTDADFTWAAKELGAEIAAIKAVIDVESNGDDDGLDESGMPLILFEAHKFSKKTGGKYDKTEPSISSKTWNRKLYTRSNASEHKRLQLASSIDRNAALESASWGMFQILGENWKESGYGSLQKFINAMYRGARGQLEAFVAFIKADPRKVEALRNKDWATFASRYNGTAYKKNKYDTKLAARYQEHV